MKVGSSTRVAGSQQEISIEVEDTDMGDIPDFANLHAAQKWKLMSKRADMLIVEYLLRNEHISEEFATQRIREISQQ